MNLRIEVTPEDIANGVRRTADSCPIALAIRRACPNAADISVNGDAELLIDHVQYTSKFPQEAHRFVDAFDWPDDADHPEAVRPFAFDAEFEPKDH